MLSTGDYWYQTLCIRGQRHIEIKNVGEYGCLTVLSGPSGASTQAPRVLKPRGVQICQNVRGLYATGIRDTPVIPGAPESWVHYTGNGSSLLAASAHRAEGLCGQRDCRKRLQRFASYRTSGGTRDHRTSATLGKPKIREAPESSSHVGWKCTWLIVAHLPCHQ